MVIIVRGFMTKRVQLYVYNLGQIIGGFSPHTPYSLNKNWSKKASDFYKQI